MKTLSYWILSWGTTLFHELSISTILARCPASPSKAQSSRAMPERDQDTQVKTSFKKTKARKNTLNSTGKSNIGKTSPSPLAWNIENGKPCQRPKNPVLISNNRIGEWSMTSSPWQLLDLPGYLCKCQLQGISGGISTASSSIFYNSYSTNSSTLLQFSHIL